ncbi:hypothetical protein [Primorskyibacter sp. S187A]|uniref:hypothetical protein n=1 Tax=Primorskyibacter sp. S187A TaxID=3415130 RepID=UPI003C7EB518
MRDFPDQPPQTELRPASRVMRLHQMGAMFPTRLSFLRVILRQLASEGAELTRPVWDIDAEGYGHAVYSIPLGGHVYSLVAISTHLPDHLRSDRVIATAWDSTYVLYDGVPDAGEIARIKANAPRQEAGRFSERELVLSRANKSVRLWSEIAEILRRGQQPDPARINEVGYLMRTTAVYGNGKFGIADRALIADRPGLDGPFAVEMLTVWMIRAFTHDLIEHVGGAPLDRDIKRHLGIGNATGLGMAPFLVSHPVLLNNWMMVRETALARVRALETLAPEDIAAIQRLVSRATGHLSEWNVPDPLAQDEIAMLRREFPAFAARHLSPEALQETRALDRAMQAASEAPAALEELVVALLLEPFGGLVDGLACCMADPLGPLAPPIETTEALRASIETHCGWALGRDYTSPEQAGQFWYVSEEKLEPRLGQRFEEPGADRESPLDVARRIAALHCALPEADMSVTAFLTEFPEHLMAVERVQVAAHYPYAEIQDNLIAADTRPIDMLRAKLAMFGAAKFDPKSDLWTRITLAQGAPLPDELTPELVDHWWLPTAPHAVSP